MIGPPPPTHDRRVYRASYARRRRRRRLVALIVAVVIIGAAVAAGAWALGFGHNDGSAGGEAGASGASTPGVAANTATGGLATATPSVSPSPTPTPPTVISIGWIGDTTPGSKYGLPPNGGRALFAAVRDELRAPDLMIANLEGTYSTPGASKSDGNTTGTSFSFQAPPSYAKALPWAGIDLVSVANNHSFDYFQRGLDQTKAALTKVGVDYAGLPNEVKVVDVDGVRVAVVAFSPYPWNADINDIPAARKLVKRAAGKADLVVVLMHAGAEGADKTHTPHGTEAAYGENRGDPRAFAHAAIDSGADLVFGSGPHVIRGIERYKDRLIAYSLGNFGGWGNFGTGGTLSLSGLLTVRIDDNAKIRGGRWLSLYIGGSGAPTVDSANTAAHLVKQLSTSDFTKTYKLSANGSFTAK
jgi:hypothetical protein